MTYDKNAYNYLLNLLTASKEKSYTTELLDALLTDKEKKDLANRLRIFAMVQQEKTQRDISASLGVGIATVTRGVKAYQQHEVEKLLPDIGDVLSR